ncbi:PREDICTED: uncharacterized protein LOC108771391 [Cyphomyrmex costatus]|uniref:uncharacterized protein LOC108771391 n=1 Tax=Cyphomyrmex costatus TaxID=456900 RepID=UPI0008522765|nr:PREDICTED: uncharacterized protein LOC108771391 [Cyphomyrmex costatus]
MDVSYQMRMIHIGFSFEGDEYEEKKDKKLEIPVTGTITAIIQERHVQSLHLGYTDREICRQFVLIVNDLMVSQSENRESIRKKDEAELELHRLREVARLAAIHHNGERKFQRRTDLSHIVHASLHFVQLVVTSAIEIFHHVHHYINQRAREKDDTIPPLPEERNPIFFVYPICMLLSFVFMILWLVRKIVPDRPMISLTVCAAGAILMLVTGIMEMKHADMYIDVTEFTDEEILEHPVFIHNFVMCILSIFVMIQYLIQAWVLFDQWQWIRMERDTSTSGTRSSESSTDTGESDYSIMEEKIDTEKQIGELAPIPTLEELIALSAISDNADVDDEPILYCCFVDWYNYVKIKMESKPKHEFQVIHVM